MRMNVVRVVAPAAALKVATGSVGCDLLDGSEVRTSHWCCGHLNGGVQGWTYYCEWWAPLMNGWMLVLQLLNVR